LKDIFKTLPGMLVIGILAITGCRSDNPAGQEPDMAGNERKVVLNVSQDAHVSGLPGAFKCDEFLSSLESCRLYPQQNVGVVKIKWQVQQGSSGKITFPPNANPCLNGNEIALDDGSGHTPSPTLQQFCNVNPKKACGVFPAQYPVPTSPSGDKVCYYKYDVTVGNVTRDPDVILDDNFPFTNKAGRQQR
jgi:hypothetical protein